jgi:hypothetical protein
MQYLVLKQVGYQRKNIDQHNQQNQFARNESSFFIWSNAFGSFLFFKNEFRIEFVFKTSMFEVGLLSREVAQQALLQVHFSVDAFFAKYQLFFPSHILILILLI